MGNCCGKADGNFSGEGRTLNSDGDNTPARPVQPRTSAPQGGRTLGTASQSPGDGLSPKEAAARAAEVRNKSTSSYKHRPAAGSRMVATAWL